ncbi:MAG: hypothetical protein ACI83O_000598 [Patescibacteria group bacterium]|jgi:hypothetical protein
MVQALITLNDETNRVLNIVKAQHSLRDKGAAIEFIVNRFTTSEEPELREDFIVKMKGIEKEKVIPLSSIDDLQRLMEI